MSFLSKIFRSILRVETVTRAFYNKDVLIVWWTDGTINKFKGNGTIWRHWPMKNRASIDWEVRLNNIRRYIDEHGTPYPTAHLRNKKGSSV